MASQILSSVITGSGSCIPERVIDNTHFDLSSFYDAQGHSLVGPNETIIRKFQQITGIRERRYAEDSLVSSDLGYRAAQQAIEHAQIDPETLDYIILAHNYGDVKAGSGCVDMVPTLAARVKHLLQIQNPYTVAYDLPFGCPGWLQALIQAHYFLQSGDAKRILVIGSETLSRVSDPHDRDSMIYADGAGAVLLEAIETEVKTGILSHLTVSDTYSQAHWLRNTHSYNLTVPQNQLYIKMDGRKIYEYALTTVPQVIQKCLQKANVALSDIQKVLIHQANEKMDEAMLERLFKLYGQEAVPEGIMPMTVNTLGNTSVATLPTLFDLVNRQALGTHTFETGKPVVFASVGAGMNANAVVYKMP